ncbi:hypothetical protein O0Q50_19470 [Priestia aryabhattai]|uniref:Uncharacterized protein n=2 Tax=Priestia TaxID=2800373 RepID=A0AAX6NCX3_PRIAR|nr:hypothetical protein [Priestia aryabhattai]MDU9693355.1 hypothetical protein [Priestia aryabhattai]
MDITKLFEGFSERYKNIMLFQPIFQLSNSKHPKYKEIDMMEVGIAVLLFMLNKMLVGEGKISPEHINSFLRTLLRERYNMQLSTEEVDDLRVYLIDDKLRNGGQKFFYQYKDLATGDMKVYSFELLTYDDFEVKNLKEKNLYLKLSQQGIEMLFKTKEMFVEM